jgi:hypothetical protein
MCIASVVSELRDEKTANSERVGCSSSPVQILPGLNPVAVTFDGLDGRVCGEMN